MFEADSRYADLANATLEVIGTDGVPRTVVYKRRRFIPLTDTLTTVMEHTFVQGDRLDNITAHYLGDPTHFWQLCDANGVLHPRELAEIGRIINIAIPKV